MKIGLFGGSFDPVHIGHLLAAQDARERIGLDRVVFIPAALSPFKTRDRPASGAHRMAMLEAAVSGLDWAEVSRIELDREGVSYTVDTVRALLTERPGDEGVLLIGLDNLKDLHRWRESEALLDLLPVYTLARPRLRVPRDLHLPPDQDEAVRTRILRGREIDISSTEIRHRRRDGKPINNLVPDTVLDYICNTSLYV